MPDTLWTLRDVTLHGHPRPRNLRARSPRPRNSRPRLDAVSTTILPGVTAVMGPSGAGKTSLLNLLVGFERPDGGEAMGPGGDPALGGLRGGREGRSAGVFWAPPGDGLWPHLTVRQHLEAVGDPRDLLERLTLTDAAEAKPATLSTGQRSRLALARALAAEPDVLVLDEPLSHVDDAAAREGWNVIRRHVARTGCSLVFSSHNAADVLEHAERVLYLDEGVVRFSGEVDELYQRPPDEALAAVLGRANWFDPEAAAAWLGLETVEPCVLRPHQLQVIACEDSPLLLEEHRVRGGVAQSLLRDETTHDTRRFWHPTSPRPLHIGQRIMLNVLTLVALAFVPAGCGDGTAPTLPVTDVTYWHNPTVDHRLPAPRSVTVGPDGRVIVLDNAGRVLIYDADGDLLRQWDMPTNEDGNPEGAAWLADGRIAVADTHYHRVLFFDQQGNLVGTLGTLSKTGEPGTFRYPVDVVQDPDGSLYVAEYGGNDRVQKFTSDGEFILEFGEVGTGPGQFQRAAGLVWHDEKIYVADAVNGKVHVFDDGGTFERELLTESLNYPYDVALGPDDTLYVIEWGAARVTQTTLDGQILGRFGEPGSSPGRFRTPWGIDVDARGRVLVADTENRRVVAITMESR